LSVASLEFTNCGPDFPELHDGNGPREPEASPPRSNSSVLLAVVEKEVKGDTSAKFLSIEVIRPWNVLGPKHKALPETEAEYASGEYSAAGA
jgi:hypothetical protein